MCCLRMMNCYNLLLSEILFCAMGGNKMFIMAVGLWSLFCACECHNKYCAEAVLFKVNY